MNKNCLRCNEEFKTKPSHFERRKYCSIKCLALSRESHEIRLCTICSTEFKFYPNTKNSTGEFCSHLCQGKKFFKPRPIKKCIICDKEFQTSIGYTKKKFCSIECYGKSMEGMRESFYDTATYEEKLERLKQTYEKYVIRNEDGCWDWKGGKSKKYGSLQFGRKNETVGAHVASYMIHKGNIPDGMFVCHSCDQTRCTFPLHLFLGTPTDNVHDMIKKGRNVITKGQDAVQSKLTESQVIDIKIRISNDETLTSIAKFFGVHIVTIHDIKYEKTWKHINLEG